MTTINLSYVPRLQWHVARPTDMVQLEASMRPGDRKEVQMLYGMPVRAVLEMCLDQSQDCYAIRELRSRNLMAVVGVAPSSMLGSGASPWMLTCNGVERYRRELLTWSRKALNVWEQDFSYLYNYVLAEYNEAVIWAKHVGFKVSDPVRFGPHRALFHKIERGVF